MSFGFGMWLGPVHMSPMEYQYNRFDAILYAAFSPILRDKAVAWTVYATEKGSGKGGTPKEYYTLECLLFILKNTLCTHTVYVKQAAAVNIPAVRRPDRKELLAYLNGETTNCPSIDTSVPPQLPIQVKRCIEYDGSENISKKPRLEDPRVQRVREKLAARPDAPKESTDAVDNIKSLLEAMSVETITAIKAKRLAKKRTTIKRNDDMGQECNIRADLESDVDITNKIISRERHWETRTTVLQSSGKTFAKNIFAMLDNIKAREEGSQRPLPQAPIVKPATKPSVYNRYDQERFNRQKEETDGFKIDTMRTYHGMSLKTLTEGSVKVQQLPKPQILPISAVRPPPGGAPQKRISRTPIIIIPAGVNCLISMYNVMELLQDLRFVTIEQKKAEGGKRNNEVLIQRRKNNHTVPYRVVDNPAKLNPVDWDRVVGVFVMGPAWQFKGYPWENPVEIFSKVAAFHLKYDEMKLDANVAKWSVTVIEISKTKRHLDRAALMMFWEKLDKHIMQFKPHLRF
ncbi:hypothetical protein WA026_005461 [Henosepilachna vigintioctopunctata]|uniref:Parafibromin n=1 Tax=Henosepilachna vigintioctopunctata TaxID=420089 RepID=A0AAW1U110_9CUCU